MLVYIRPCRQNARSKCNPKHRSPKKIVTQRKKNHNRNVIVFRKKIVTHNFKIIKKVFQFYLLPYYNAQKRFNDSQHPNLSLKNPKMLIFRSQSASGMLDPLHTRLDKDINATPAKPTTQTPLDAAAVWVTRPWLCLSRSWTGPDQSTEGRWEKKWQADSTK